MRLDREKDLVFNELPETSLLDDGGRIVLTGVVPKVVVMVVGIGALRLQACWAEARAFVFVTGDVSTAWIIVSIEAHNFVGFENVKLRVPTPVE